MFADDTSLFLLKTADELQRDFEKVRLYAWQWIMHFDVDETEEMIFSHKKLKVTHPPLHLGPELIATTTEHKHLGLPLILKLTLKFISGSYYESKKGIGLIKYL